jgi:hypothetical protein
VRAVSRSVILIGRFIFNYESGIINEELRIVDSMKIPCAKRLGFVVNGLSFLQPALTNAQMYDFTLVATALILGTWGS